MAAGDARCKWCAQPMKWAVTERGRSIPLDPDPVLDGNIELVNGVAVVLGGLELHQAHATNTVLHKSHFATCASPFNPSNRRKHDARPTSNEG